MSKSKMKISPPLFWAGFHEIMLFADTIAAIATPPGTGGIGVIRISGPDAEEIARHIVTPIPLQGFASRRLYHGDIVSPETGEILDDALIAFFRKPHSFTGEDTLEISCHGGPLILQTVMEAVLRAGARPAKHGEFTRRAYLNNRLDLAQAEAVNDLIAARSRQGLASALGRLKGGLSEKINEIREELLYLLARTEVAIDFTAEDGVEEETIDHLSEIERIIDRIDSLAATYRQGKIERTGFGVVIAGRPNAGKSSLLNRLLGEKRAIVAPQPGTTRDFIEETAEIAGLPVRLTDTAGLRTPRDEVEKEGIAFLWEKLEGADAVILLIDASSPISAEDFEIIDKIPGKPVLIALNKSDLPSRVDEHSLAAFLPAPPPSFVAISAKYGHGMEELASAIRRLAIDTDSGGAPSPATIAHAHQKASLEKAAESLRRAADGLRDSEGMTPEIVALEIREALNFIGEITGRTSNDDILNHIFSRFCIGK